MKTILAILILCAVLRGQAADQRGEFETGRACYQEGDFKKAVVHFRLALKADQPLHVSGVVIVKNRLAIENDDVVVAIRLDVVVIPLIVQDLYGRRFERAHQTSRVVAGRLVIPDL